MKPVRIQRKRTMGYDMEEHSKSLNGLDYVYVGRPSVWGNPFPVDVYGRDFSLELYKELVEFRINFKSSDFDLQSLKDKNLACWCPLNKPCHADILLELVQENKFPKGVLNADYN